MGPLMIGELDFFVPKDGFGFLTAFHWMHTKLLAFAWHPLTQSYVAQSERAKEFFSSNLKITRVVLTGYNGKSTMLLPQSPSENKSL